MNLLDGVVGFFLELTVHVPWLAKCFHADFSVNVLPDLIGCLDRFHFVNIGEPLMEEGILVLKGGLTEQLETFYVPVTDMLFLCIDVNGKVKEVTYK